jgi:hypothetical protein
MYLTFVATHFLPHLNRDAVYRILKAEGLGRLPPADRSRRSHSRFKANDLGFVHVDVKHLPKLRTSNGESRNRYLYVAIDRDPRFVHLAVKDDGTEHSAVAFLKEAVQAFPFQVTHVLPCADRPRLLGILMRWLVGCEGMVSPACHTAHAARVTAGSREGTGAGTSVRIAVRRSRSQGCSTALVPRSAGCSRTWPDAGWNRVRILVVPPRMYSCGCFAGCSRGCHDTPGCGTAWKGPASSSHQTDSPSSAPRV